MTRAPTITPSVCLHPKPGDRPRPKGSAKAERRTMRTPTIISVLASAGLCMVASFRVLLDHLVRPLQERRGDRQAERLGGFEVEHQLELCGLLNGQVAWLGPLLNLVSIDGKARVRVTLTRAVAHQPARVDILAPPEH